MCFMDSRPVFLVVCVTGVVNADVFVLVCSAGFPGSGGGRVRSGAVSGASAGGGDGAGRVWHAVHTDASRDGGAAAHAVQLHVSLVGTRTRERPGARRALLHLADLRTHEHAAGEHPQDHLQQPGHRRGSLDEETRRYSGIH